MKRINLISGVVLTCVLLVLQVMTVSAAPANQDPGPIIGTVNSIAFETDAGTGTTTVVVTITNESGAAQTFRLSLEDATILELVLDGETINPDAIGKQIEIDPALTIPDGPGDGDEEKLHPVGSKIAEFFSDLLGVDYGIVMGYHDEGVGFGVIAQALWMTNALEGDSDTFAAILEAKQTKDFGAITLPDGSTPQNWGQFRKAVMQDRKKSKENLGAIMSGRAEADQGDETQEDTENNGNGNEPDKNNGKNKDKGNNGNGNGNNKDKNKDKGNSP